MPDVFGVRRDGVSYFRLQGIEIALDALAGGKIPACVFLIDGNDGVHRSRPLRAELEVIGFQDVDSVPGGREESWVKVAVAGGYFNAGQLAHAVEVGDGEGINLAGDL